MFFEIFLGGSPVVLLHLPLMCNSEDIGREGGRETVRKGEREGGKKGRERVRESCHLTDCWCSVAQCAAPLTYKGARLLAHRSAYIKPITNLLESHTCEVVPVG